MTLTTLHRRGLLSAALAFPSLAEAQPRSQPASGPFRFKGPSGAETDAERGFFDVPEDRRVLSD